MKSFLTLFLIIGLSALATVVSARTTSASVSNSTNLKTYAGSYSFASGSPLDKFVVTVEKGALYGEADEHSKTNLFVMPL